MKLIFKTIISILINTIILYILGSFIEASFIIKEWDGITRLMIGLLWFAIIYSLIINYLSERDL